MTDPVDGAQGSSPVPAPESAAPQPAPAAAPEAPPSPPAAAAPDPAAAPAAEAPDHTKEQSLLARYDAEQAAAAAAKPSEEAPKPAADPEKPSVEGEKPAVDAAKPAEAKPEEKKPGEGDKPTEEAKPAEKTPEQIGAEAAEAARLEAERHDYTKLEIPKDLVADDEKMGQALDTLKEYKVPVDAARKLLDIHTNTLKEFAENTAKHALSEQHRVFGETRKAWVNEVKADPEMGGAGFQTSMAAIAKVRDMFVPESERAAFNQFCAVTGAGDNPAFLRMLYRASKVLNEPSMPPPNPKPAPNGAGKAGRRATLYDHPSSQPGSRQ